QEPGEAHCNHQRARAVVGPPRPRVQPAAYERPAQQEADHTEQRSVAFVVARHDEQERHDAGRDADRQPHEPGATAHFHQSSATSAAPESSALGTNPRAPLRSTSAPNSDTSRLDVSTTAGELPFEVSRAATSKPSMSGSCTSSKTTSGRSRRTASIAPAPSSAS